MTQKKYGSVILGLLFTFLYKIKEYYKTSSALKILKAVGGWFRRLGAGSKILGFIRRESFLSKIWEHSLFCRFSDWLLDAPSGMLRRLFNRFERVLLGSWFFKHLRIALDRFEVLIAAVLVIIAVVPHKHWFNGYSTIMVVLLALLYFVKTAVRKDEKLSLRKIDFSMAIFAVAVLMSVVTSFFPKASLESFVLYATCFLLVLVIVNSVKTTNSVNRLIRLVLYGISISGLYGIWQSIKGIPVDPALVDIRLNQGMPGRVYSTMYDPNSYAEVLVLMLPFFLVPILNEKEISKKIRYMLLALPPLVAMVLTGSRSAWGSLAVGIFIFVCLKNIKLAPLIPVAGILAIPFMPGFVVNRVMTIFNSNDSSATYRLLIYKNVLPLFKDFWTTGLGLGPVPFTQILQRYDQLTYSIIPHSHNLFLEVWIETGLVGIIAFLWFMFRLVKRCIASISAKTDMKTSHILMASIAAFSGISVIGMVEYVWFYPRTMLFFWFVAGVALAGINILAKKGRLDT